MRHPFILTAVCLSCAVGNMQAQKFTTGAYSDKVKTLQVHPADRWDAAPAVDLNGAGKILIGFDMMEAARGAYTYTITHCNADWTSSQLIQSEFMDGFQNRYVDDCAASFNTTVNYVNYRITFPNEEVRLKISGNYAVQVFPEYDDTPVLCACFSLVERKADIVMQATSQTDRGMNNSFQQVNFTLTCGNEVKTPVQDLKVFVRQNNRTDNEAALVKPLRIQGNQLIYEHVPSLIFEAGNEYRNFEMTTHQYNGLNIEAIKYYPPCYHVLLYPHPVRAGRSYSYYEDINGKVFIRTLSGTDAGTEADYYMVHFFLPCENPYSEAVYILSEAFNNLLDKRSKMDYNPVEGGYEKSVLLKEGYYNYLYVTRKNGKSGGSTALPEGNYYQTENEYRVLVYFRRTGDRYDRFIGTQTLQFK
ncbi:MAG: DUF5103 domain-containing protein [Dysgonamonadaceae bacterium]|jgi:hypothetical protein|nr:DUF5103 domain-containing protein [Dysgonamonadaceae bacterium]